MEVKYLYRVTALTAWNQHISIMHLLSQLVFTL